MYEQNLALKSLLWLICHKRKPNKYVFDSGEAKFIHWVLRLWIFTNFCRYFLSEILNYQRGIVRRFRFNPACY